MAPAPCLTLLFELAPPCTTPYTFLANPFDQTINRDGGGPFTDLGGGGAMGRLLHCLRCPGGPETRLHGGHSLPARLQPV